MSTRIPDPTRRGLLWKVSRWALPLAMAGLAAPSFAQDQQELKFRFASVQRPGIYLDGITKFTELVKQRTGGKVQIEVFCCSQLGGERQIMDGVKLGTIGMGSIGATGSATYDLLFMPFIFRDLDHAQKVVNGAVGAKWQDDFYKQTGVRQVGYLINGSRMFLTNKRMLNSPADAKGLKIRAPEIPTIVASLRALGASPVVIAAPELYTALQQGTADGWEGPLAYMADNKHWEVGKNLAVVEWVFNITNTIINDSVWKRMTPQTQAIVRDSWKEVAAEITRKEWAKQDELVELFRSKGVAIARPPVTPFQEATKDVWKQFAPKVWGEGVYEQIQATK
jgi:tripartite ATP-independent transporter DctP family solute receptor